MRYPDRATVCVSSQAGCGMACPFCATGQGGLQRNLSTAEIVEQVRQAAAAARDGALGEPAGCPTSCSWAWASRWRTTTGWSRAVRRITDPAPDGLGLSARGVPSRRSAWSPRSTGWPPRACRSRSPCQPARAGRRAARHAGAGQHPLEGGARCSRPPAAYADATGRRVSIEYALIRDVNDQPWRARTAGRAAADSARHQRGARQPDPAEPDPGQRVGRLAAAGAARVRPRGARPAGVACTVRDTRGREIAGACGQLAADRRPV